MSRMQNSLGQLPAGASSLISTGASMAGRFGAMALGYSSMAGPIGMAIGAIVTIITSLFQFGPKPKEPVFGLAALVPREDGQKLRVGRLLAIMEKNPVNMGACWGLTRKSQACIDQFVVIKAIVLSEPLGALGFVSGGTPKAHEAVTSANFNEIKQHTHRIAEPFNVALAQIKNQQVKEKLLAYDLGYRIATNDYYFLFPGWKSGCTNQTFKDSPWCTSGIGGRFDEIKINRTRDLSQAFNNGLKQFTNKLNEAFISVVGLDVINGKVTSQSLVDQAMNVSISPSTITASLPQSSWGLLLLLGGGIFLFSRR